MYNLGAPPMLAGVFCHLVFAKSNGKTHVTPTIPAILALMIRGTKLFIFRNVNIHSLLITIINIFYKVYPKSAVFDIFCYNK